MKNQVIRVEIEDINKIKKELNETSSIFIAEIDGKEISNEEKYLSLVSGIFDFPYKSIHLDSYLDWIRDLDWLEVDEYAIIIYNYSKFLANDIIVKGIIINDFLEVILPWWEKDVEECVVEGKAKPFNVYLVD